MSPTDSLAILEPIVTNPGSQNRRPDGEGAAPFRAGTERGEPGNEGRRETEKLSLLLGLAEVANQAMDAEIVLRLALARVCEFTGWPAACLRLQLEDAAAAAPPVSFWRFPESTTETGAVREPLPAGGEVSASLFDEVLAVQSPVWKIFPEAVAFAGGLEFRSAFAVPLVVASVKVGALEFFTSETIAADPWLTDLAVLAALQLGRVAERERARRFLRRSELYFRKMTEFSLDLISVLDAGGVIRYESRSIEQVLGYPPQEYIGRNAFEFVHPEDVPRVGAAFAEALGRNGSTPVLTFRFRHRDGSWRLLEGMGNSLLNDPIIRGVIFNSRDITEKKELEEQFLQSQKMQAIGQLAGGIAHDFNNMLTAVLCNCDLLFRETRPGQALHGYGAEIKRAAERAAGLTRQLLAFGRKQMLQPQILDLNASVQEMRKMLDRVIGENIELVTKPLEGLGQIKADPGQIEQVLLNLCINARDAMPNGGRLLIQTDNVTLDENYAKQRSDVTPGEYVMLAVTDNGTGMPPEVMRRVFEPFFTTKEPGRGTGLGLATCHGIMRQSGGHIAVQSEVGKGTTFKIFLPRVHGVLASATQAKPQRTLMPGGTERILLVEDEATIRRVSSLALTDLGYDVVTALNGVQALETMETEAEPFALLITDMVMPVMGGRALADQVKVQYRDTRIIFTTGYTDEAMAEGDELGEFSYFLPKPYTLPALAKAVRQLLDKAID